MINHQPNIYLYAKDSFEAKYQLLINKRENTKFFLLNSRMTWMIFMKILKNKIRIRNVKY